MTLNLTRRQSIAIGLAAGFVLPAIAQDNPVKSPWPAELKIAKSLQNYLTTPRVLGKGTYSVWGLDIYHATLWGSEKIMHPDQWHTQRLALELRYARDFDGKDIAKRSVDEMHMQSPLAQDKAQAWLKTLESLFPNVRKDQTLTGIYLPGANSQFLSNENPIGSINDPDLAQRFFAIWLSPKTSAQKLRKALLGDLPDKSP